MQNYLSHFAVHVRISFLYGFPVVKQLDCVTVSSICEPNCSAVFWSSATLKSKYLSFFWFHLALQGVAWELFLYWTNFKVNLILLKNWFYRKHIRTLKEYILGVYPIWWENWIYESKLSLAEVSNRSPFDFSRCNSEGSICSCFILWLAKPSLT